MLIKPKRLFLIDGIGGLITASLLFFLLARLEHIFGMPKKILYILSLVAIYYSIYSLSCHYIIKQNWKPFLFMIAIANALYCIATMILLAYYYSRLTWLGLIYFISEIIIITILILVEIRVAKTA
jgi:hypothetical protein